MKRSSSGDILIQLKQIKIGKRRLRYIYIPQSLMESKEFMKETDKECCLLFLGCDVLSSTSVLPKNMARTHTRLLKSKQCSKISFPHRLAGVAGHTKDAWFYSIHGLFRSVFEFYDFAEQVLVLRYLFHIWSIANERFLPEKLILTDHNFIDKEMFVTVIIDRIDNCKICEETACSKRMCMSRNNKSVATQCSMSWNKKSVATQCTIHYSSVASQYDLNVCMNRSSQTVYCKNKMISQFTQSDKIVSNEKQCQTEYVKIDQHTSPTHLPDHMNCSSEEYHSHRIESASFQEFNINMQSKQDVVANSMHGTLSLSLINSVAKHIKTYFPLALKNIKYYKVYVLLETFLDLIKEEVLRIESTTTGIFPFHLMTEYCNLRKSCDHINQENPIERDLYYRECALHVISKWLAGEFNKLQTAITSQIDEFKRKQIAMNKLIPNPVEIISQHHLYPSFMVELSTWVGGYQREEERTFFCSRLLLVLELLNDTLLTGMGHVVYAKLKCNYAM
ncbi:uncharacterized protein LOC130622178 [Hydractinia symbiolongicarpus]|uniref:uncharacterized protein LOC130622178 n=1 Tax=Hydractinia symbiolongicarpus TaxID=13093 RepID=UPI00254CD4B3|nr:uncharacterized protein LOC130622178 [Hydractinia symbiolongicarpus]